MFALAALTPALAVGWLGLRALQGQEDATRRELSLQLQAVAERTSRRAQDEVDTSTARLGKSALSGPANSLAPIIDELKPVFADTIVVSPDGDVLFPAPPSPSRDAARRPEAPSHCAGLATTLAASRGARDVVQRFAAECKEARSSTGRWLWPMVALRAPAVAEPDAFADWVEGHASSMRRSERAAGAEEARRATWLSSSVRERIVRAWTSGTTTHESVTRTLRVEGASGSLRAGPDSTGLLRWRSGGSWGVLRQTPGGTLAGFVVHAPSLDAAIRRGWAGSSEYKATVREGVPLGASDLVRVAPIAPALGIELGLADPSLPARAAARSRAVLVLVGAGAMVVAFAIAALLFARMRAASRLSELRTGFVSTVSHELRTPIASVRMLAELLEQGRVEPDERDEVHAALAREARRLGDTVDRLLGFSRMAAGRYVLQREEGSVVDVVLECIETFEQRHPELPKVDKRLPPSLVADIDGGQLGLAIDNLLENARKYAPQGTPYRVAVRQDGDWVELEVGDRGPGIERRDRKRLFRAFERGDDRLSSAVQGSGIGLSLVSHVARAHGGTAVIDTEPGGGTCVRIRIPRRAA